MEDMKMKKIFNDPELTITGISVEDVISTSSLLDENELPGMSINP